MILIQNVILVVLLWQYMQPKATVGHISSIVVMFLAVTVICIYLPAEYLYVLPLTNLPLMLYSRLVQIYANVQQGTTGQLSSITTTLTFLGSLARIFTTMQEVGMDVSLLTGFGSAALLSAILLAQVSCKIPVVVLLFWL